MESKDLIVVLVLAVFVIYGLANWLLAPIILKRVYKQQGLTDTGKASFDAYNSVLLEPLATDHLYQGNYQGFQLQHAKCALQHRPRFTLSKHTRKKMQSRWSVTILGTEKNLPAFTLLPKTDPDTIALMLTNPGVDLSRDKELEPRYLLLTDHIESTISLLTGEFKEQLVGRDFPAIEVIDNKVLIKRSWPTERIEQTLVNDFNCAVSIAHKQSQIDNNAT